MTSTNYGWGLPVAASTFAKEIDFGIYLIHGAMFLIFILWGIFFTYLLIRYRHRSGVAAAGHHPKLFWSLLPDMLVLIFEVTLIVVYAIPVWSRIKIKTPSRERSNVVEVMAEQFAWSMRYPGPDGKFGRKDVKFVDSANVMGIDPEDPAGKDDIVSINEMHVPLGIPTIAELTSKDVVHSFFVPEFRIKQDAVPGIKMDVWFEPTLLGRFEIGCAQLCGVGHANMRGDVYVQTPEEYESWLAAQAPALQGGAQ